MFVSDSGYIIYTIGQHLSLSSHEAVIYFPRVFPQLLDSFSLESHIVPLS